MSKIRVHALAKEIGITSKELILKLNEMEIPVKNHMSTLESADEERIRKLYKKSSSKNESPVKNDNSKNSRDVKAKSEVAKNSKDKKEKTNKVKTSNDQRQKKDYDKEFFDERKIENHKGNKNHKNKKEESFEDEDFNSNRKNRFKNKKDNKRENNNSYNRDLTKKKPKKKVKSRHKTEEENRGDDPITVIAPITVKDFADQLGVSVSTVITKLIGLGVMANQNQSIDEDTCILLADELGVEIDIEEPKLDESIEEEYGLLKKDKERDLKTRPPVVTVMGHVDHGKTSLLDSIKKTHVTQSEAGGITQHIGAYTVNLAGKKITFLDTPGHEAFTSMRLRGAQTTDIAVLVVAADDGVMPQTLEAISHARSAEVPIIVAITKIDKPEANPERVKQELMNENLLAEEWGGDTIVVGVSSKTGEGIDELLEMILLVAEMRELKANPNRRAIGTIIEANLDKAKGPMATILIKNGTLRFGDSIVSGVCSGRIRAMQDDKGKQVKKAGPSMPVVVLGLNEVPNAGDTIYAVNDDKTAKAIADKNAEITREKRLSQTTKISLDNLFEKISEEDVKELNIVVKADVKGSVEALNQSLLKLSTDEVKISIIHSGVGGINESDVTLASASNAIVIGFNVRPNINAIELAKAEDVEIRTYRVIYEIINDIEQAAKGMLDPDIVEEILGRCEIRQTFKLPNNQMVAGVYVLNGKILRNSKVKVLRDDVVIHEGDIASLKRFKDDTKELATGFEGGLVIDGFNDIKEGDLLESYILKEVKRA
ncbi:translation initiation factor IF-2 [Peptoniphilus sp. HMSC062D09]|uniref:translation initiation factor IF-2 n=1 Tax=Peptoniphilus sp. HMSC062D09 TaxID=1739305 RepID=UPI0008A30D92|nr:translation initiation factor IF-2 [Peptoniphilus sp. HMSC062D09]OFK83387.1 translation initiation factor IF-2 [Peptoniphilus sp. HMSC062D09]